VTHGTHVAGGAICRRGTVGLQNTVVAWAQRETMIITTLIRLRTKPCEQIKWDLFFAKRKKKEENKYIQNSAVYDKNSFVPLANMLSFHRAKAACNLLSQQTKTCETLTDIITMGMA
jgi:hypothetical protein